MTMTKSITAQSIRTGRLLLRSRYNSSTLRCKTKDTLLTAVPVRLLSTAATWQQQSHQQTNLGTRRESHSLHLNSLGAADVVDMSYDCVVGSAFADAQQQKRQDSPSLGHHRTQAVDNTSTLNDDDSAVLLQKYRRMVKEQGFTEDIHQMEALESLERLRAALVETPPPPMPPPGSFLLSSMTTSKGTKATESNNSSGGWFAKAFSSILSINEATMSTTTALPGSSKSSPVSVAASSLVPRGVYLHGGVGCGKTMLMQLFHEHIKESSAESESTQNAILWQKEIQKVHFHAFMLHVHQEMHTARYKNKNPNDSSYHPPEPDSVIPAVVEKIASEGRLICFDEFQVTDVADALILQRLFTGLWRDYNCVIVATSNRPPEQLYWNGLQRDRFLPFIDLLQEHCEVVSMVSSDTDYRLLMSNETATGKEQNDNNHQVNGAAALPKIKKGQVYFTGGKEARQQFNTLFYELVGPHVAVSPKSLSTQGRQVKIPLGSLKRGIARFSFEDLCQKALGAADYLVIGKYFHTVFVEKIPALTVNEINWLRRFIIFVDTMYECHVKLVLHTKTLPPDQIFVANDDSTTKNTVKKEEQQGEQPKQLDLKSAHDEVFAFDRTASRLREMSSNTYLKQSKKWVGWEHRNKEDSAASILSRRQATVTLHPSLADSGM